MTSRSLARRPSARRFADGAISVALAAAALVVLLLAAAIVAMIARAGIAGFFQGGGLGHMLTGRAWSPDGSPPSFGFAGFLFATLITAAGGVAFGAVPAVLAAIYLAEFAGERARRTFRRVMEVAAALPSVVYGYVAATHLVPLFADPRRGCQGLGVGPATVVLAAMIAPTVALLALDALGRTPEGLRDASAALGVSRWQTTWRAVVPTAWRGLLIATFFGFARAAGETMAVQMVMGNGSFAPMAALRPAGAHLAANACASVAGLELFRPSSTISTRIVMDLPEAQPGSPWSNALFSMSLVLLVVSTAVVIVTRRLSRRAAY